MPDQMLLIAIVAGFTAVIALLWVLTRPLRGLSAAMRSDTAAIRSDAAALRTDAAAAQTQVRMETAMLISQAASTTDQALDRLRNNVAEKFDGLRATTLEIASTGRMEALQIATANEARFETMRATVEGKLQAIREDNAKQLEEMRRTVDEKLQATLETRLTQNFSAVVEQLDRVHKGLGEMQSLATGVGDLKRVLTNVKVRGNWGEVQLEALLEQVMSPEQYAKNVAVRPSSAQRVEFAIRLPGSGGDAGHVWLPIDAKFPQEDYLRLIEAYEQSDQLGFESASKALEVRIRGCAKDICDGYLHPPHTTDFGIMFLPTEGLYAEVARRPGLLSALQNDYRVMVAGPSTLAAMLNSIQMGFRTLAIQQRTSEVLNVLVTVKSEFAKFDTVLQKVGKKLQEASNTVESAQVRTRVMNRNLRHVELLGAGEASPQPRLLLEGGPLDEGEDPWAESIVA